LEKKFNQETSFLSEFILTQWLDVLAPFSGTLSVLVLRQRFFEKG